MYRLTEYDNSTGKVRRYMETKSYKLVLVFIRFGLSTKLKIVLLEFIKSNTTIQEVKMPKIKRKYYIVEGENTFPIDMLRYDHSWPHSESKDSPFISHHPYQEPMEKRRVMLVTDNPSAPNLDRWKSFGWRVIVSDWETYLVEDWRDMNRVGRYV